MGVVGHDVPETGVAREDTARLGATSRDESAGEQQQQQQPGLVRFGSVQRGWSVDMGHYPSIIVSECAGGQGGSIIMFSFCVPSSCRSVSSHMFLCIMDL
jgi:hypothetical protein